MKKTNSAMARVCSMLLTIIILFTMMPASAYASIDEPMNVVESFGDLPNESITDPPLIVIEGSTEAGSESESYNDVDDAEDTHSGADKNADDSDDENDDSDLTSNKSEESDGEVATATSATVATEGTLGISGPVLELPPEVAEEFLAFLAAVGEVIESPPPRTRAAPGDTGTVSWNRFIFV